MDHKSKENKVKHKPKTALLHDPFADLDFTNIDDDVILSNEKSEELLQEAEAPQLSQHREKPYSSEFMPVISLESNEKEKDPVDLSSPDPLDLLGLGLVEDIVEPALVDEPVQPSPGTENRNKDYLKNIIAQIDREYDLSHSEDSSMRLLPNAGSTDTDQEISRNEGEQNIVFRLNQTDYTVPVLNLLEIGRPLPTTFVPNLPPWVKGVSNLRGEIISIVDLPLFLGFSPVDMKSGTRLLVTKTHNEELTVGLLVDEVKGISFLNKNEIQEPTGEINRAVSAYMRGVYEQNEQLLIVLNLEKLLLSPEMQAFE